MNLAMLSEVEEPEIEEYLGDRTLAGCTAVKSYLGQTQEHVQALRVVRVI